MSSQKKYSILDFERDLTEAERYLRNRRQIREADAVNMAKQVVLPFLLRAYEKEKGEKNGEN